MEQVYGPDQEKVFVLRWWPAKGGEIFLKTIHPEFVDIAKDSIKKLKTLTDDARKVSLWYENNPDKLFLPDGTAHLRGEEWLTMSDLAAILGSKNAKNAKHWCIYTAKIKISSDDRVRFSDVQQKILSLLPNNFPIFSEYSGLKYSEALFPILKNQLHPGRNAMLCMIEIPSLNTVNYGLGSRVKHGSMSIFTRFGFTEPDGSPIKISTHQFRHLLNTIMQRNRMSQLVIAKLSGRVNIKQNADYDHTSADEMLDIIQTKIGNNNEMFFPLAKIPEYLPISRDEFARLKAPTVHISDIGVCIHDFVMSPCQKFRKCIKCEDLICVKGDPQKAARLKEHLEEARNCLKRAEEAFAEDFSGSDLWIEMYKETVERYEQLNAFMENQKIPNGAIIQLAPPKMNTAIENRKWLSLAPA